MPTVGRNDPCPCGSGRKYKRCCLAKEAAQEREVATHRGAAGRALAWLQEHHGAAIDEAMAADLLEHFGERGPEGMGRLEELKDMIVPNLLEWLLAEGEIEVDDEPRRVIDLVLGPGGPLLDADQRRWLEALAGAPLELLEVQESEPGRGLWVKSVFDSQDERRWVAERTASRQLQAWDLFAARPLPWDEHWELSGCIYPFERSDLPLLREEVRRVRRSRALKADPAAAPRIIGLILREFWLESLLVPPPDIADLQLVDAKTGEPVVFVTDHFRVRDWGRLTAALAAQPDVEGDRREGWVRFEEVGDDVRRSLLSLEVAKGDRVKAFARTVRAADVGRSWLVAIAGDSMDFLRRELSDPKALLSRAAAEGRPRAAAGAVPMTTELAQAMYDHFYRGWADEAIPALDGKTPRQAVRSKAGRQKVVDLLKSYEQGELHRAREEQREPASLQFLWDAVGLDRGSFLG